MGKAFGFIRHQFARAFHKLHRMNVSVKGTVLSFFQNDKAGKADYPVDLVITWVDGNDEEWLKEKEKYFEQTGSQIIKRENPVGRYRDWGLLRYWFRAAEKYAPWARYVFFVTCGQKPDWLNTNNGKIRFVSHKEFIPPEYLPTFCSDTIELNLWRIKDLSEHFIYLNDDVFLNRPVSPEDFFANGLPKLTAIATPTQVLGKVRPWIRRGFNDFAVINEAFNITKAIEKHPEKWFAHCLNDKAKEYNRRALEDGYIIGMYNNHCAMPFLKDSFRQLWQGYYDALNETCMTKFRTHRDVTVRLLLFWMIFSGDFWQVPQDYYGHSIDLSAKTIENAVAVIRRSECISVCLNDSHKTSAEEFPELQSRLKEAFTAKFPDKSSYERE